MTRSHEDETTSDQNRFDVFRDIWLAHIKSYGESLELEEDWPNLAVCLDSPLRRRPTVEAFHLTEDEKHHYSETIIPGLVHDLKAQIVGLLVCVVSPEKGPSPAEELLLAMLFASGREESYLADVLRQTAKHPTLTPWRSVPGREVHGLYIDPLRKIFRARLS